MEQDERDNEGTDIAEVFRKAYEPTAEDIAREMSDEELIEICQRVKCRVDMFRWNAVQDYVQHFTERNRFNNKTAVQKNQLLAKAVNRHKDHAVYSGDYIKEKMDEEWPQRKKDNLMRLNLWRWEKENESQPDEDEVEKIENQSIEYVEIENQLIEYLEIENESIQYEEIVETNPIENGQTDSPCNAPDASNQAYQEADLSDRYRIIGTESMTLYTESEQSNAVIASSQPNAVGRSPLNTQDFNSPIKLTSTQNTNSQPEKVDNNNLPIIYSGYLAFSPQSMTATENIYTQTIYGDDVEVE